MHRSFSLLLGAGIALVLFLVACRSGIREERFDAWDERVVDAIDFASAQKDECAAQEPSAARDLSIAEWDELLRTLMVVRSAGALAYLQDDDKSLVELEKSLTMLLLAMPVRPEDAGAEHLQADAR